MMDPSDLVDRLAAVEADNARLRRLLNEAGTSDTTRNALRETVALLRVIVRRSSESSCDVENYVAHLEGRIDSLMRMRARTDAFGEADLHLLVSEELLFHLVREGERAVIKGPQIRLRPKAAQVLALAIYELVSNAVEHGPLDRPQGTLLVSWRLVADEDTPVLILTWTERGGHLEGGIPTKRGFGREVLETMLAYELGAQTGLTFEPEGLSCRIRFPLTPRIGRAVADGAEPASPGDPVGEQAPSSQQKG